MKMKAAVLHEQGRPRPYVDSKPMTVEEVDLDPPGEGLAVKRSGCHRLFSSVHIVQRRSIPASSAFPVWNTTR